MSQLSLRAITKQYPSPEGMEPVSVLHELSLDLEAGEAVSIVGPSGCGKSTLLNIIGTLDTPTSGEVILNGKDLATLSEDDVAQVRNRSIGFVFQSHHLLPQCTVLENVLIPTLAYASNSSPEKKKSRAEGLIERVGLTPRSHHRPSQLSGGERQRVALVRALVNQPVLLLADEPTGSLDPETARQLSDLLIDLNREEGVTLVVVTHSMELASRMPRRLQLEQGRLTDVGDEE